MDVFHQIFPKKISLIKIFAEKKKVNVWGKFSHPKRRTSM